MELLRPWVWVSCWDLLLILLWFRIFYLLMVFLAVLLWLLGDTAWERDWLFNFLLNIVIYCLGIIWVEGNADFVIILRRLEGLVKAGLLFLCEIVFWVSPRYDTFLLSHSWVVLAEATYNLSLLLRWLGEKVNSPARGRYESRIFCDRRGMLILTLSM